MTGRAVVIPWTEPGSATPVGPAVNGGDTRGTARVDRSTVTNDDEPPAIRIGVLRIWIHGYEFPESTDAWDRNCLRVTAHCAQSGASVVVTGSILDTVSFLRFHRELVAVSERLQGTATLDSSGPDLRVDVRAQGPRGEMDVQIDITPDRAKQAHRFSLTMDRFSQSCLAFAKHPL